MLIPVRCFSCNKVIGHLEDAYKKMSENIGCQKTFEKLGINRICCKRMLVSYSDLTNNMNAYDNFNNPKIEIDKKSVDIKNIRTI